MLRAWFATIREDCFQARRQHDSAAGKKVNKGSKGSQKLTRGHPEPIYGDFPDFAGALPADLCLGGLRSTH